MPLYEYKCDRCGGVFEVRQKFADAPVEVHEGCGGHVERLLSAPALQFKGTGWYVTDYARNSGNGKSAGKNEPKPSGNADSKKSEPAKPAASSTTSEKK